MTIFGRPILAFYLAGALVFLSVTPAHPSYSSKAGHAYETASRRLADLKKSPEKNKYRSYWIDCIRAFELVERKYAKSPHARNACFDRAETYLGLYKRSRMTKDLDESLKVYGKCQAAYPRHARASEALFRIIELSLDYKKDGKHAADALSRLSKSYPRSSWTQKAKARLKRPALPAGGKQRQAPPDRERRIASAGVVVNKIRHRSGGNYTRIVIDCKSKAKFRVFELRNPSRLVFDLLNSRLGPFVDKKPLEINDGILREVRASQFAPDTVRVVLDLASIKSYAAFPLRNPERLVIDVMGEASGGSAGPASTARTRAVSGDGSGDGFSLSRQMGLKIRTIAIDAGHGGRDPGAIGSRGTKEKNINLDIAKRLAVLVKEGLEREVVMTRERDVFIPLEDRPAIARTKGADLFVSIHVNATRRRGARGIETYIQGLRASDRAAMETAARENATTTKTLGELDDELTKILTGLRMESNDDDSIRLAHAVQGSLVAAMKPIQGNVADLGVKRAFFYVLINTGMPSILAEVGFISNPVEERLLNTKSYRQAIADALYKGLKKYVELHEPR